MTTTIARGMDYQWHTSGTVTNTTFKNIYKRKYM